MKDEIKTLVFDLDGTIYQNTVFHRDYLRFLVEGTDKASWADELIRYADAVFCGERLEMNSFYTYTRIEAATPEMYFCALESARQPDFLYEEALLRSDCIYTGDAWAVVTLIGKTLGLLEGDRNDAVYQRTREKMSADGMTGSVRLRDAIRSLSGSFETILLSNSYESTAVAFLEQLGYSNTFEKTVFSANKPGGILDALCTQDATLLDRPQSVLTIGDHAFNDLMPLQQLGSRSLWVNPFPNIRKPACDASVRTPEELAEYLEELLRRKLQGSSASSFER